MSPSGSEEIVSEDYDVLIMGAVRKQCFGEASPALLSARPGLSGTAEPETHVVTMRSSLAIFGLDTRPRRGDRSRRRDWHLRFLVTPMAALA